LRQKPLFVPFTAEELAFMRQFKMGEEVVAPRTTVLSQGERSPVLYTVLSGFGTRSLLLENGRRQVINFVMPGDFLGLQAGIMGEMRHSVHAVTEMVLCRFSRSRLWDLFRNRPDRAYDLTWIAAIEEHFLGETIATLGQRNALERMAWALTRIWQRLSAVGLQRGDSVPLPYRQHDMADALGMSLVHTNRVVATLRARDLATWSGGTLRIHDLPALSDIAGIPLQREAQRPIL
jgi:CRP-like cAMP-binding protein